MKAFLKYQVLYLRLLYHYTIAWHAIGYGSVFEWPLDIGWPGNDVTAWFE